LWFNTALPLLKKKKQKAFLGPPVVPAKMASLEVQAEMEDPDFLGHKDSQV